MSKKIVRASPKETQITSGDDSGAVAARQALRLIGMMRNRLRMADGWFRTISRVHRYFIRIKKDFQRNSRGLIEARSINEQNIPVNLRNGSQGGGLVESKMIDMALKEFGSLEDEDMEMADAPDLGESGHAGSSDAASTGVKSESYGIQERTPESGPVRQDRWNAINSFGPGPQAMDTSAPNGAPAGYYSTPVSNAAIPTANQANHHQRVGSNVASPLLSPPTTFGPGQFPPHPPQQTSESTLQAHVSLQQQMHAQPAPAPPLGPEQAEGWLNSIDTRFTADDVTAFVEGKDWQEWANGAAGPLGVGGWLSKLWTSPSN